MSPHLTGIVDLLTTAGFRGGWSVVRRLPERTAHTLFEAAADLATTRNGQGVQRLRSNYARVRPELADDALDRLVRDGMRSYLRYWCEAFRLPNLTPDDVRARVRVVGDGPVREHLAAGRPVLAFLGHLGNWDLAGAWGTLDLGPVVTVAERLEPEELFLEFLAFRERLGMRILPLTGGGDVFAALRDALAEPVVLPLLGDRDLTSTGVEVDLCGHRARVAAGPALLAVRTGTALFPTSIHYERCATLRSGWRTVITFHDPVADPGSGGLTARVAALAQGCADELGAAITRHTEDWHMLQRVFTADLDPAGQVPR